MTSGAPGVIPGQPVSSAPPKRCASTTTSAPGEATEIAGHPLSAGTAVFRDMSSANRDSDTFDVLDDMNPERTQPAPSVPVPQSRLGHPGPELQVALEASKADPFVSLVSVWPCEWETVWGHINLPLRCRPLPFSLAAASVDGGASCSELELFEGAAPRVRRSQGAAGAVSSSARTSSPRGRLVGCPLSNPWTRRVRPALVGRR